MFIVRTFLWVAVGTWCFGVYQMFLNVSLEKVAFKSGAVLF